uniref:Protein dispatched homolog 1 n=1 Tax=Erpetoichthys calabaricus TaxID=27687 RepID=A0A8C4XD83_ERPCA
MAMSKENDDLLVHGYGGISANAASSSVSSSSSSSSSFDRIAPAVDGVSNASDGIPSASPQQLSVQEVQRSKVSQNGSLKQNGTLKLPALSSDNPRSPLLMEQVLPHCCHHCPFHHPFSCHNNQQDCHLVGGSSPATSPLTPCCAHHHSEYPAVRPIHSPVHQTTCCHQPPASFCLHHCWQDHFQHQAIQAHKPSKRPSRSFRFPKSYSELIADWPVIVLGVCTVFIIVCALVGVLVPEFPDFSDPMLGFEPRGTEISQRLTTLDNMRRRTGYKTTLANYPLKYAEMQANSHREDKWSEDHSEKFKRQAERPFQREDFLCPLKYYDYSASRVVYSSAEGKNLWNVQAIKSMCRLDFERIQSHPEFSNICLRKVSESCCPSWILGNYIALLNNKSSCHYITDRDASDTLKLLRSCAKFYHNGTLHSECWEKSSRRKEQAKCPNVPRKCTKFNAVYQILHYLVDKDFLSPETADYVMPTLKYSMLLSPMYGGSKDEKMNIYLDNFEKWNYSDGITAVTGIDFGIKFRLFELYLIKDTVYPAIAILLVLLIICVYTKSMFITFMTMLAVISSLIVSYFLYRIIFALEFFPFMNLTTFIILVGIGADDAFVLCDVWNYAKVDKPSTEISQTVSITLQHAALSMFVTSFTTAAAFYANFVNDITAIRCFGIFAGTAILVNYVLMITWLPAVVVLHERYLLNIFDCFKKPQPQAYDTKSCWILLCQKLRNLTYAISEASRILFEKVLPYIVIKFRYIWLFWFLAITVGGAYVVCVNPKMKLPSQEISGFQVLRSSHPFERYIAEYKKLFMFERIRSSDERHMSVMIIWGIKPLDNGDPLNPNDKGNLTVDNEFNISSPASQAWMLNFCKKIRNQTFIIQTDEQDITSCFIETFKRWMESRDCDEAAAYPCCNQFTFPYKAEDFELCLKRAIMQLDTTSFSLNRDTPGPRFDLNDTIRAVILNFQSSYFFSYTYDKMDQFFKEVDTWVKEELKTAPEGLRNGWFVSTDLLFYDLQGSLSHGTMVAMGLSVTVAFIVMLLTTWNIVISLYAIISITGTIFVTVGSLVLLGWELNVLESVTISVAVGLSVDFAVHYGVAYRLAPYHDRDRKVRFSISRMGSAIAMAALTTFVAGALMMPSNVLAYTQLGTFMMLIMCISWAFATFFFQCMCRCIGPQGNCGQIPLPKVLQCQAFLHNSTAQSPKSQTSLCNSSKCPVDSKHGEMEHHEHYELKPLSPHGCSAVEKIMCEETQVSSRLLNGRHHHRCVHLPPSTCEPYESCPHIKDVQTCSEPRPAGQYSVNQTCRGVESYHCVRKPWNSHNCQQLGDGITSLAKPLNADGPVSTLDALHPSVDCCLRHIQHFHCSLPPCFQDKMARHAVPKNILPNYCVHSVHQLAHKKERFCTHEPPSLQGTEDSRIHLDCGAAVTMVKPSHGLSTSPKSVGQDVDRTGEDKSSQNQKLNDNEPFLTDHGTGRTVGQNLTKQCMEPRSVTHEDVHTPHVTPPETMTLSCLETSQSFSRTLKVKCNSQMPNSDASVPAVLQSTTESLC